MAFKAVGKLGESYGGPIMQARIITNSQETTEMDSVKIASGFLALGTTGASVFGHVTGIRTKKGVGLETTGAAGAETGSFVGTFTAASDNQTVAMVKAECDISKNTIYSADPDGTIGTTTGSNLAGYYTDIADETETDETDAATTTGQYAIHGVDPADSGNQLVTIFESSVFGPLA